MLRGRFVFIGYRRSNISVMIAIATHAATTSSISISIASKARINTIFLPFSRTSGGIDSVMARDAKQHEVVGSIPSTLREGADMMYASDGKYPGRTATLGAHLAARRATSTGALYCDLTGGLVFRFGIFGAPRVSLLAGFLLALGAL